MVKRVGFHIIEVLRFVKEARVFGVAIHFSIDVFIGGTIDVTAVCNPRVLGQVAPFISE